MTFLNENINEIANYVVLFFTLMASFAVVLAKDLLTATIMLGLFSLLMATEYLVLSAPDVAITEAAVGAGISTVLLLLGIFLFGAKQKRAAKSNKLEVLMLVSAVALLLMCAMAKMPEFGSAVAPAKVGVADYYVKNAVANTGATNVVAAVLASYRGYDTFGEVMVIFTAGICVVMLLGVISKNKIG